MSHPVTDIEGIEPDEILALKKAGIRTTEKLLEAAASFKLRKELAERTDIALKRLLVLVNAADRMRVKGVGKDHAGLLQAAGVNTVRELKFRNAEKLRTAMKKANEERKLVRLLPSSKKVERWIKEAQSLPHKVTY